jgi:hypothetical protein
MHPVVQSIVLPYAIYSSASIILASSVELPTVAALILKQKHTYPLLAVV